MTALCAVFKLARTALNLEGHLSQPALAMIDAGPVLLDGVTIPSSLEECREQTGCDPIPSQWLDLNKGDQGSPQIRSMLVAMETQCLQHRYQCLERALCRDTTT